MRPSNNSNKTKFKYTQSHMHTRKHARETNRMLQTDPLQLI